MVKVLEIVFFADRPLALKGLSMNFMYNLVVPELNIDGKYLVSITLS